jgi:hypothetical protein
VNPTRYDPASLQTNLKWRNPVVTPKIIVPLAVLAFIAISPVPKTTWAATDCGNAPWQPSNGRTCASMGLDSNRSMCRAGEAFALNCDDTKTQIRTCATNQLCPAAVNAVRCPSPIRKDYGRDGCDAYQKGYLFGKRDARDNVRENFERYPEQYTRSTLSPFKRGYQAAYKE